MSTPRHIDSTPFLGSASDELRTRRFARRPSLRGAARFMRRASGGARRMRESSVRVREAAAEQLEERRSDWAYSKPIVVLDMAWNLAFVVVAITVLAMSRHESPSMPLRLWIVGYALQCALHMVCVFVEYKRRRRYLNHLMLGGWSGGNLNFTSNLDPNSNSSSGSEAGEYRSAPSEDDCAASVAKHLESANTMFSFIWWIIGFYWVSAAGESLTQDSPQLYWLCITFLAFDVFFVVICVVVACLIGIAVCCCLPCIIAILYAVADQEGAAKEDIDRLPKYKYQRISDFEKLNGEIQESFGGIMTECNTDSPIEHILSAEDAECCICLCAYDDGTELRELPCRHHFHCSCIDKWLYINATCPLCKFNILKSESQSGSEEV
ncbi:E3 ubiquitin-protein ligase At1g12760-like isoform X2 [Malania oleifera]|uniref:E3 ubiquitin-protein ligase At1g12760-like isoform X2 n=1 Tax=Malania oleifera TaxID=397392 RepID=UPI0025AE8669|nr:E3 ubiquitin-protein ligase At1g12760-like isoform X2 [Malania oleifera]